MNILFWGNSELSVPFLELVSTEYKNLIKAVITIPDKPQGRGMKITPSAVKLVAQKLKLNIIETDDIKNQHFVSLIQSFNPQLSIVVSYGKIIPAEVINLHKIGMLNIHFSLLPKYRGAAPIQWTLYNGEKETGVTIFWLDTGMDTGDIFVQDKIEILLNDNYYTLSEKLVKLGCEMLKNVIKKIFNSEIVKIPQQGVPSYAPLIKKEEGKINWSYSAKKIHDLVRAFVHWPKAYSMLHLSCGKTLSVKILETDVVNYTFCGNSYDIKYGTIIDVQKDYMIVYCGEGTLLKILKLQPENKKILTAKEFICGYRVKRFDNFV